MTITAARVLAVAAGILAGVAWAGTRGNPLDSGVLESAPAGLVITPVPTPAGAASAQPQLSVSARGVLLSWIERNTGTGREPGSATLKFSELSGGRWSEPRTIASGDNWFVNWADVPSAMRLPNGTIVAHWLQKSAASTYAYDVRLSYSKDDGRTWSPSFLPHHDGTQTEHGFASLFPMPRGGLGLIWLDGRAMKGGEHGPGGSGDAAKAGDSHGGAGGAMSVRFGAFDENWKQVADAPVDLRVCECCPTAVAVTASGAIAAYRDRSEGEIRDIYVSRLENGKWSEGKPAFNDGWKIAACPVNGPALSTIGRDVAIAWFSAKDDQGRAWLAFSKDEGRSFGPPLRLDEAGALGRVDVEMLPGGGAAATWIEFANQRAQFRMRAIDGRGAAGSPVTIAGIEGSRASGYPRMARDGATLVFAWTESNAGALQVRTASAKLP
jgi:hypothetical protein